MKGLGTGEAGTVTHRLCYFSGGFILVLPVEDFGVHIVKAKAVLAQIVEDQRRTIDRLATMVLDGGGTVDYGEFPMSFTSLHDLSLSYLIKLMIDRQQKLIAVCDKLADRLNLAPFAQAAAREAVGEAKGPLDNLLDLQAGLART